MDKTIVFYGSSVGNTRYVAEKLAKLLSNAKAVNVKDASPDMLSAHKQLIIGTSTWGIGSFQDDFYAFVNLLEKADLSQHTVALFGLGDQFNYPDSFCDGMGKLYDILVGKGCTVVGDWPSDDYTFSESQALKNGRLVGLALDEDNEPDLTNYRLKTWVQLIKEPLGLQMRG
jgi:flavodoxin I